LPPVSKPVEPVAPPTDISSTALNGAQVASLLEIVLQVSQGLLTKESAKALASAAFPTLSIDILNRIFDPVKIQPQPTDPTQSAEIPK
jgi:hypothetical protein